jgi:hypothetical protein
LVGQLGIKSTPAGGTKPPRPGYNGLVIQIPNWRLKIMKNVITHRQAETKIVTFEPGNATRYYLVITKTSEYNFLVTWMNALGGPKPVELSAKWTEYDFIYHSLTEAGWGKGDAEPVAEYLQQVLNQTAFITFREEDIDGFLKTTTSWFYDNPEAWNDRLAEIGENGWVELERGTIWED